MNINQYLKSIGITKTDLALAIGLSRPTLNQYIKLYEMGQTIENERYDIIFKRLFSDGQANREMFNQKMDGVKFLLERDKKYDIVSLNPEAADIVAQIHNYMVQDMSKGNWDKKVYDAISLFLTNYRNNDLFRELAGYFSDLNLDSDLSELSDQTKAYYSCFLKFFREIIKNTPKFDKNEYENFVNRRKEILKEREERNNRTTERVKNMVEKALKEIESEYQEKGIEASEDEIMTEVIRRINNI